MKAKAALFTLVDARGRILLQHRSDDAPTLPGLWGFFGGGVRKRETFHEALKREAHEELRLALPEMRFVRSVRTGIADATISRRLYVGRLDLDPADLRKRQREGQGLGVFSLEEIRSLPMAAHDRLFVARLHQWLLALDLRAPPHESRDALVDRVRARAAELGVRSRIAKGDVAMPEVHPGCVRPEDVAIVSLGNRREGHGPALAVDIDDRVGTGVAIRVCEATGARYIGHAPFASDRFSGLSIEWSPVVLPFPEFYARVVAWTRRQLEELYGASRPTRVVFVSGHGGNGLLADHLSELARDLGVTDVGYELAIAVPPDLPSRFDTQHASCAEHSLAAALGRGCIDTRELDESVSRWQEDRAFHNDLGAHPSMGGMAGHYILGDETFDPIRTRYSGVKRSVAAFVHDRAVSADARVGRRILRYTVRKIAKAIMQASLRVAEGA
jgi:8-oxo-dGTP diphosphatase